MPCRSAAAWAAGTGGKGSRSARADRSCGGGASRFSPSADKKWRHKSSSPFSWRTPARLRGRPAGAGRCLRTPPSPSLADGLPPVAPPASVFSGEPSEDRKHRARSSSGLRIGMPCRETGLRGCVLWPCVRPEAPPSRAEKDRSAFRLRDGADPEEGGRTFPPLSVAAGVLGLRSAASWRRLPFSHLLSLSKVIARVRPCAAGRWRPRPCGAIGPVRPSRCAPRDGCRHGRPPGR